jgi:HSP90 family molecular chaperone
MANKKTQKDFFNEIIEVLNEVGREDLVDFCQDRIEKLSRKASSKKPTKTQKENENLKEYVVEVLASLDSPVTTSALASEPRLGITTQKLTPILKTLVSEGRVTRIEEKGKALFILAQAEDSEDEE